MNDLAFLLYRDLNNCDESVQWYLESLRLEHHQQRARYNVAGMYMDRKRYADARKLLEEATRESKWQIDESTARTADVRYKPGMLPKPYGASGLGG